MVRERPQKSMADAVVRADMLDTVRIDRDGQLSWRGLANLGQLPLEQNVKVWKLLGRWM